MRNVLAEQPHVVPSVSGMLNYDPELHRGTWEICQNGYSAKC